MRAGEGLIISERARALVLKRHGLTGNETANQLVKTLSGKAKRDAAGRFSKVQFVSKGGQSISGKVALQGLIQEQELRLREGHRMFTAMSARFKGDMKATTFSYSKGKQTGRGSHVKEGAFSDRYDFDWSGAVGKWAGVAATGLTNQSRIQIQDEALKKTNSEMLLDLARVHEQAARNAARSVR